MSLRPGEPLSAAVETRAEPPPAAGELLVEGWCVGVCGTDREIMRGARGRPPDGRGRLVLGHESLGTVLAAPEGSGFRAADLVVGMVRRPDPAPCACCAAGEWDSCRTGGYTSRGITGRDGYGAQRWCVPPAYAVRVDPRLGRLGVLTEPTSVLAKAWERIDRLREHGPGALAGGEARHALIAGAGTMGLLAALLAAARGYRTAVLARRFAARATSLVRRIGARAVAPDDLDREPAPDVVVDTTGAPSVVAELAGRAARNAIVCLVGLGGGGAAPVALGPLLERLVTTNGVVFGTVNAAPRHYRQAVAALSVADPGWLDDLITRRVPLARWSEALDRRPDDVKVVVDLVAAG